MSMASISTSIKLTDKMTSPLLSITKALNTTIDAFEEMENSMNGSFNTSKIDSARSSIESANTAIINMGNDIEDNINKQDRFNQEVNEGSRNLDNMAGKVKGVVAAFIGFSAIKGAINWMKESFDLADIQSNAETQLKVVLANMGAAEGSFDKIKKKASEIQGMTVFGDEAMISGAAELSTYLKDANAVTKMMDTLANYATGMSGGGEVNSQQMTEYATQLGKVLIGSYDGIKKKGFELTEAQEKIIENGTDMEKALVIDEVINESWQQLAENMAKTPQGKLIQFQNIMGDLREEAGNKLYPAFLNLIDVLEKHLPQIESLMNGVCSILTFATNVVTGLAVAAGYVAQFIGENWSIIEPIVWGIVTALVAYELVSGIVTGVIAAQTMAESVHAAATAMATGATFAQTAAQYGLNAALLACPLTWILIAIIAIIAAIYVIIGVINKLTGSSISATGIIMGAFYTLAAYIYNSFIVPVWNYIASFINFFANVFNDPIASIKILFLDMAVSVIGYVENMLKAIEKLINKIPGVKVNITSGISSFKNDLESKIQDIKDESGYKEVASKLDYWDYGDAWNAGYAKGQSIEDSVSGMFSGDAFNLDSLGLDAIANDLNNISSDTGNISDSLDVTDEDLKYLRDLAEQEAINRFTTAEIHVDMGGITNNVSNNTDVDGIVNHLVETLEVAMEETARGV